MSRSVSGKHHDKTIFTEQGMEAVIPLKSELYVDLGFLGLEKDCPGLEKIKRPKKKPRGGELCKTDKEKNRAISRTRIKIENAFAGVKRLWICWSIFRNIKKGLDHLAFMLCCSLWNFHLKN